ncbi:hypothetical protein [Caloranaerobacter sp. DY30410]|uniref:hypothetical protein n=1 Tax=Caloranaerobacter sp. DY30410 TaxID=3238305 RepID=UPI003CFBE6C2
MSNSFVLNMLHRIWDNICIFYDNSCLKAINCRIGNYFKFLSNGSVVIHFFTNEKSLFQSSLFYKVYTHLIDKLMCIFYCSRKVVKKYKDNSFLYKAVSSLFQNEQEGFYSVSIFIITFSLVTITINIIRGGVIISNLLLLILLIIGIFMFKTRKYFADIIRNSFFVNIIRNLFMIDDGGE